MATPSRRIQKGRVDDLVLLEKVEEDTLLQTLKNRFNDKNIYSYIGSEGSVLLSINPFKQIGGLYGKDVIGKYIGKLGYDMPPHVYGVAENAYRNMCRDNANQCILVSGESGAGKTEAAKRLLEYIVEVSTSNVARDRRSTVRNGVKDALLNSNPVLEAFGNAKTIRNDNSSRFGKYMEILFDEAGVPFAGKVSNYLLESPRVVSQGKGEQNYHVFYLMLEGMPQETKQKLMFSEEMTACQFAYLANKERDEKTGGTFSELQHNMKTLGFSQQQVDDIFRTCAAVLWLGNIDFDDDHKADERSGRSGSSVSKKDGSAVALANAAMLLGVSQTVLSESLTNRKIVTGGDTLNKVLKREEAYETRDALAKALYGRTFQSLVSCINKVLEPPGQNTTSYGGQDFVSSIGVLDIYGFEIFDKNSFEQLCINYCNEKLQQLFIDLTLKAEQQEYEDENIPWEHIDYFNNKDVCDLIEQKKRGAPGLLALIDEECSLLGRVSDQTLIQKLDRTLRKHQHYTEVKTSPDHFVINHYAGNVKYDARGFLDKNKDTLFRDLIELMGTSELESVRELFPEHKADRDQSKPPTAGMQFKAQMLELVSNLGKCNPSYIRCIKSNDDKAPCTFDMDRCRDQVRYLGILENVKVRRAGYAHRVGKEDFVHRYKCLSAKTWPHAPESEEVATQHIFEALNCDADAYKFGLNKVFIRNPMTLFALEGAREVRVSQLATKIQVCFRQFQARKMLKLMRERAIALFNDSKRRGKSFRFYFCGDYVQAGQDKVVRSLILNERILFADTVTKVTRDCKRMQRLFVLTSKELVLFKPTKSHGAKKPARRARVPIQSITKVTLSSFADGYVAFEVDGGSSPTVFLYTQRKAEIITVLKDTVPNLAIDFRDKFQVITAKGMREVSFEESAAAKAQYMPNYAVSKTADGPHMKVLVPPNLASRALIGIGASVA